MLNPAKSEKRFLLLNFARIHLLSVNALEFGIPNSVILAPNVRTSRNSF